MPDSNTIETIKAVGAIVTPIAIALIALLQLKISKKQDTIHHQIDGMQEKLITAEKSASESIGKEKGIAENQAQTDAKPQEKK